MAAAFAGTKRRAPDPSSSKLCIDVHPERYELELHQKARSLESTFARALPVSSNIELHRCDLVSGGFRMRAEFAVKRSREGRLFHCMFDGKEPVEVEHYPMGSSTMQRLMRNLLPAIQASELLSSKLFQVNYLTSLTGDAVVVLLYHKQLTDDWSAKAQMLEHTLNASVMGRARKQRIVLSKDYVIEELLVNNEHISLKLPEGQFSQPNSGVAAKMAAWTQSAAKQCPGSALLEMYCGSGTLTVPASRIFSKVLATEIAKPLVNAASYNMSANNANNVTFARLGAEEVRQAMSKERRFRRLEDANIDLNELDTVLVDPPRAGCGREVMQFLRRFSAIIYISCNPVSCCEDFETISDEFQIERIAAFDQFPYTDHLECGVLLVKRPDAPGRQTEGPQQNGDGDG